MIVLASLNPIKLYRGIPSNSSFTTAHSVAVGKKVILKQVRITNTTATDATITIMTGTTPIPDGQGTYLTNLVTVRGRDVVIFELNEVLDAGESIYITQGTASALHVQVSGVEVVS